MQWLLSFSMLPFSYMLPVYVPSLEPWFSGQPKPVTLEGGRIPFWWEAQVSSPGMICGHTDCVCFALFRPDSSGRII